MKELLNLKEIELTKTNQEEIANNFLEVIEGGYINPLETFIKIDFLMKALDKAKKKLSGQAIEEVEKYGNEGSVLDVDFKTKEAGVRYDYSTSEKWKELNEIKKAYEEKMKLALKHVVVDEETGEVVRKPIKSSSTTIELKYKK